MSGLFCLHGIEELSLSKLKECHQNAERLVWEPGLWSAVLGLGSECQAWLGALLLKLNGYTWVVVWLRELLLYLSFLTWPSQWEAEKRLLLPCSGV